MVDFTPLIAEMQKVVVAKALHDPAFMVQFKDNPRGAVESVFKTQLPANVKVEFQIAPPNTVQVVFPHVMAVGAGGELSDADLESVAGGGKSTDPNVRQAMMEDALRRIQAGTYQ